jgi:hypothetical protein
MSPSKRALLPQDDPIANAEYWHGAAYTAFIERDLAFKDADRNRRAFKMASFVAAVMALAAIAGWVR